MIELKMKKLRYGILSFFGVCILFLLSLLFLIVGQKIESHYKENLKVITQNTKIPVKIVSYKRHWFYSEVLLVALLPLADGTPENMSEKDDNVLFIKQTLYHGPLILAPKPHSKHLFLKFLMAYIESSFLNGNHFAYTTITITGLSNTHLASKETAIERYDYTKNIYYLSGLTGDITLDATKTHFASTITCDVLESFVFHPGKILNFKVDAHLTKAQSGMWVGETRFSMGHLTWTHDNKRFVLGGLNTDIISRQMEGRIQTTVAGKIQTAKIDGKDYGPQTIASNIFNLDSISLKKLQDFLIQWPPIPN